MGQQYRVAAGLGWMPAPTEGAMPVLKTHIHMGEELADSVDWTTKGAVTPIKDQGQCGSCWAFGTVGGIEGSWQIATGALKSGSEQQLVDCSKFPNMGCSGGNPSIAVGFETKHNVQMIETHNAQGASFTMGINQSTDLTQQQYRVAAGLGWMPAPTEGAMPVLKTHIHMGEELADSV